ncbi:hypothetical protein ACA910_006860 [Epithemia clementina (nom. ined.)]
MRLHPSACISTEVIVPQSLSFVFIHEFQAGLYPTPACHELSVRASSQTLAALVWYYNWVNDDGFHASMQKSLKHMIPGYISWAVPNFVLGLALQSTRSKFRTQVARTLGVSETELDDAAAMRARLVDELVYLQSLLQQDESQLYLIPNTTQPTAADFSVYAQLERLVGEGTKSDVRVDPAIQSFKTEAQPQLARLWQWYNHMRDTCPVQFKGKRPPKEFF